MGFIIPLPLVNKNSSETRALLFQRALQNTKAPANTGAAPAKDPENQPVGSMLLTYMPSATNVTWDVSCHRLNQCVMLLLINLCIQDCLGHSECHA
jgi:hypothetical protein